MTPKSEAISRWFTVDQARIDAFAGATDDWQFIHTDPTAAADGPYGRPVAHGFLTLSLLSAMYRDALPDPDGLTSALNLGFDKLRFLAPVPVSARIRGVFTLIATDGSVAGQVSNTWAVRVEIEDDKRPAILARWRTRQYIKTDV